ncbi:hypothetical protein [Pseudomonas vanderleydeniana]|uniref:Crocagin biosynthetic protein CgnE/B domain-containing protein n=1 Tax=Pseudomonas vanderleydeniana TaxID=2745495 RepID=A0A9E6TT73_9PSED|nr:hypothetical protein [Pseudomonas vanderleydeniana]QXI28920.1 hypothetical protein HU752_002860 [Pseudomonas vanderleydeniana]
MNPYRLPDLLAYPEKAVIVADSEIFIRGLRELGLEASLLGNLERLPAQSLAFSFSPQGARQLYQRAARTAHKQTLLCPLHAFDTGLENALYSLMLLLRCNFADCLRRQQHYLAQLNGLRRLHLTSANSRAEVWLNGRCAPYALTRNEIGDSFVLSATELFEVHYAHMRPDCPDIFQVSGVLHISGLLLSRGSRARPLPDGLASDMHRLAEQVARHDAWLHIEHNQVRSFKVAGEEYLDLLGQAAGQRGLYLSEFAIGVNEAIGPNINYLRNSPMNEGIRGVHVALGDGLNGYHIDFLCPGVEVLPG